MLYRFLYLTLFITTVLVTVSCRHSKHNIKPEKVEPNIITNDFRDNYVGEYKGSIWNRKSYLHRTQLDTMISDLTFKVFYDIEDSANYFSRLDLLYTLPALHIIVIDEKGDTLSEPNSNHLWGIDTNDELTYNYDEHGTTSYNNDGGFQSNDSLVFVYGFAYSKGGGSLVIRALKNK